MEKLREILTNQDHISRHNELCKKVVESAEKEKTGMTSKELIRKIKDRYSELSRKGWEWQSFYNGALEGFGVGINAKIPEPKHETVEQCCNNCRAISDCPLIWNRDDWNLEDDYCSKYTHN